MENNPREIDNFSTIVDEIIYYMNSVGARIRKIREEKGISQEAMALELQITQSNYGRLEKDDKRLTVPKLTKIAEVLDVSIAYIFNEQSSQVIHQMHNENPSAYNVENLYQNNKDVYDKLEKIQADRIKHLETEVTFLRNQLQQSSKK